MIATTEAEIENLRVAGRLMKEVVDEVLSKVGPGVSSWVLEETAREATISRGATCSYLGYTEDRIHKYPTALCVSVNHQIAHSPATKEKVFKNGDVVSIDFGLEYKGAYMDTAYTVIVGQGDKKADNLLRGTREALDAAISAAQVGGHTGDIGAAVEKVAKKYGLGVVKDLRGHGVGGAVHEEPLVPNYGKAGTGEELVEGMVLALEPIFAEGSGAMIDEKDGYTYSTRDGSRAAHFEHTVIITKDGPEILTA